MILIIGADLGGLALAQGLVKAGIPVTVFERDESPTSRVQGYRISIRSLGMGVLAGLLTAEQISLAKVADLGDGFTCANEKMDPFFTVPQGQDAAVQLLRSELRRLLQEGVNIQWSKRLVGFADNGDQVVAHFEDGSSAVGELLVGCDGGGSTVRGLLPPLESIPKVVEYNRAILAGQIDRTPEWEELLPLNKGGLVRFVGSHAHDLGVCFSQRVDRTPTIFWAVSEEVEDRSAPWYRFDQEAILNHCQQLMEGEPWHENLKRLVHETPLEGVMAPWLIRTTRFPDLDRFPMVPTGRVTLLGDAAHSMPTERGLGGNHALEDARLLSALLASSPKSIDWPRVIGVFEREMFARARVAVQESESAAAYFRSLKKETSFATIACL